MHKPLRQEAGFGLIELLMAMTILTVGILAVAAAFNSGIVTLRRSGIISNASVLADKQMELYRSLTYGAIALDPSSIPGTTPYTSDSAYSASQVTTSCNTPLPPQCNASQSTTGPDHHPYRLDTYIVDEHPVPAPPGTPTPQGGSRSLRKVTVVVRDGRSLSKVLARSTSTFDCSTALPYATGCPTT
jgi:prepilin-type N-terminal cleavage/methylation domain-containing protein